MGILLLNAGSSSLKYQVIKDGESIATGPTASFDGRLVTELALHRHWVAKEAFVRAWRFAAYSLRAGCRTSESKAGVGKVLSMGKWAWMSRTGNERLTCYLRSASCLRLIE